MLSVERRQLILKLIQERGSITVFELSELYEVGDETIRRDLNKMASENLIDKIYGGATIRENMHRVLPVATRKVLHVEEKKKIAKYCISLIKDGDTIFLDGSSTAMKIAEILKGFKNLIVITHAVDISCCLSENSAIKVIGIGGTMRNMTRTFVGNSAVTSVGKYYADFAFICCDGIDRKRGITDANEEEACVRRTMLEHASQKVLIADHSKFNKTSFTSITDFKNINLTVTDRPLTNEWINHFKKNQVEYYFCES